MVSLGKAQLVAALLLVVGCHDSFNQAEGGEQVPWNGTVRHQQPGLDQWYEQINQDSWSVCETGRSQSPIHITAADMVTDKSLGKLSARYKAKINDATIANNGHSVVVNLPPSSGALKINGVKYRPAQFHFHMPSEHHVMNQSFPLEMHLVHKSRGGNLAVIAYLFVQGKESEFLAQFTDKLPSYKKAHVQLNMGKIKLLKQNRNYGHYMGSLTTPPCTENVTWIVMLWNFPTVSTQQLKLIRNTVQHTNNRPTFPSHGRSFHTSF